MQSDHESAKTMKLTLDSQRQIYCKKEKELNTPKESIEIMLKNTAIFKLSEDLFTRLSYIPLDFKLDPCLKLIFMADFIVYLYS